MRPPARRNVMFIGLIAATLCLAAPGQLAHCAEQAATAKATHVEVGSIGQTPETKFGTLTAFALNTEGDLLACDSKERLIKVIDVRGKLLGTWKLPFGPTRIRTTAGGVVYVGGDNVIAKLDANGKTLKTTKSDGTDFPKAKVSGIAVTDKHVFVSLGKGGSLRARAVIVRFDRDLDNPKQIAAGLRGCCRRLDLAAKDGVLYVAENARHRVLRCDANGKVLSQWGRRSRTEVEGFGSCCNPMNISFGPGGELYTAESGLGRVKRYAADGTFLGLVGEVGVRRFTRAGRLAISCSNITLSVSSDGKLVFVQDVSTNLIRVLKLKAAK